jgi:glycosyltransferase involved in cell wall biosynthesis
MSQKLKVAWLGHQSQDQGDGLLTYSREMVAGLRAKGAQVLFVHHGKVGGRVDDTIALKSLTTGHRYIISSPRSKRTIVDLLKEERVDVVHASLSFSTSVDFGLPELCHAMGIPVVATFHVPFDSRFSLWHATSSAIYRVYSQSLAQYDRVIIFSEIQRDLLAQYGVPRERILVLPNGVDVEKYTPGPSDLKPELQARLVVGYCGRLDAEKNVEALARAFSDLDPPDDVHLVVVGSGSERRRLERRYRDPRVHFMGQVPDEARRIGMLRGMDIFVLPSVVEGLSLSLLEGMACGAATVATDVGSDGEALQGAGLVIDPKLADAQLPLALETLLTYPEFRQQLARLARQRVVARYSLAKNLDRLLALYADLQRLRVADHAAVDVIGRPGDVG